MGRADLQVRPDGMPFLAIRGPNPRDATRSCRPLQSNPLHRAIYLTGPTASGKTAVGVALARRLNAEVIALDSMTVYRGMDIGTAKPTLDERHGVPHHLIDVLDPWESASVAWYRDLAQGIAESILARGRVPLFVGGTPLYLKACLRGLFRGPAADLELRADLEQEASSDLHRRLVTVDPASAARLHENDRRRVIRALEVHDLTGRPLSAFQKEHDQPASGVKVVALRRPREFLHERINRRVHEMFENGFVDEVCALQEASRPLGDVSAQGVGYRELIELLAGRMNLAQTIEAIQIRTRQFAKRQETWFRGLAEVIAWPVEESETAQETAGRLESWIALEK